jgi:SAM-dependent methyltransferase
MPIRFTAHNIRLDDGTLTKPEMSHSMDADPWFVAARRLLDTIFPGDKGGVRLADLGCLEGGYAVEFARMGFSVLGVDVRDASIEACRYVQSKTNLPNLRFVCDDVWNLPQHGRFDVVFCCGLLYHLDRPRQFLEMLSSLTAKVLIVQTHFAAQDSRWREILPTWALRPLRRIAKLPKTGAETFALSPIADNELLRGRWFTEFATDADFEKRDNAKWSSWGNRRSFWIQREYLLQAILDVGFDLVLEQYDSLGPNIVDTMLNGYYRTHSRGTFIGIKTVT